jgi:hypothetical protein
VQFLSEFPAALGSLNMSSRFIQLVFVLALAGCVAVHLEPEADRVRVIPSQAAPNGCTLVGPVEGSARAWFMAYDAADENAMRRIKNAAVAQKANLVILSTSGTSFSGPRYRGEAYACPEK